MSIDTDFFSGINAAAAAEEEHKKTWKLPEHNELRFEVEQSEVVTVKLLSGTAEIVCTNGHWRDLYGGVGLQVCTTLWAPD